MRTLHLIESAHSGHSTTGMHSFLSVSVHMAIVIAALYATTRPLAEHERVPDPRVYFVPERPATVAPSAPAPAQAAPKRTAPAPVPAKVAVAPTVVPVTIPPVELPLADPSQGVVGPPVQAGLETPAAVGDGQVGRAGPYEVGEVEVPAAPLSKSGPAYPDRAIRLGLSGMVTARFIVAADGRVETEVVILESTSAEFTSAVRDFLRRARYRAARVGGQPVRQLVEQRFVFELRR